MKKTSCIIVEDEPHAMQLLEDYICKIPTLNLMIKCYDANEAMRFLSKCTVDVVFLDINLPKLSGLEMAAIIPANQKIIFTTAYSEYALDSFNFQVIDYLLKPITFIRFNQAIQKLQTYPTLSNKNHLDEPGHEGKTFLFLKNGRQMHKFHYDDIFYFEAMKEYIAVHTISGKVLVYKRMKDVEQILPENFVRIHNSYIININKIGNFNSSLVKLHNIELPVSNGYRELFLKRLKPDIL